MSITDETLFILVVCAAMPCLVETLERGLPAFHCPQTRGVREVFAKILQAMDRKHLRAEVCIKYPCFIRTNYSYLNQYSTQAGCAETDILAKSQENSGKSWKQIFNSMKQTSAIISFKMAAIIRHAGRVTSSSATIPELLDSLEPLHLIDLTWSDWSWFLAAWCIHMHPCWKTLKHTLLGLKDPLHWDQPKVLQRGRQTLLCLRGNELNLQTTESVNPCFIILNLQCKNQHTEYLKPQKFLFASENSAASSSQTPLPFGHWPDLGSQDGNSPVPALKNASENVAQENHEWENDIQHRHTLIVYRHEQNSW